MCKTHLKLLCEQINVAALFVVEVGIGPEQLGLLFKGTPALELAHSGRVMPSLHASDKLLKLLDRQGVGDDLVVVSQGAREQIDERLEIGLVITRSRARSVRMEKRSQILLAR